MPKKKPFQKKTNEELRRHWMSEVVPVKDRPVTNRQGWGYVYEDDRDTPGMWTRGKPRPTEYPDPRTNPIRIAGEKYERDLKQHRKEKGMDPFGMSGNTEYGSLF